MPGRGLAPRLKGEPATVSAAPAGPDGAGRRSAGERWPAGRAGRLTWPAEPPPLRMVLVLGDRAGHRAPAPVLGRVAHGVTPVCTPPGGSWRTLAEGIQRLLGRRGRGGRPPGTTDRIMAWSAAAAAEWNGAPTPGAGGGTRAARRRRPREKR